MSKTLCLLVSDKKIFPCFSCDLWGGALLAPWAKFEETLSRFYAYYIVSGKKIVFGLPIQAYVK